MSRIHKAVTFILVIAISCWTLKADPDDDDPIDAEVGLGVVFNAEEDALVS